MKAIKTLALGLGVCLTPLVYAQSGEAPVILEAESGVLGADFATDTFTDETTVYVYPTNDHTDVGTANEPGSAGRVSTYEVTFPGPGQYQAYLRFRVGEDVGSDDSFFIAWGTPDPLAADGWSMCNNVWELGYTDEAAVVDGGGSNGALAFRWINLSAWNACNFDVTVTTDTLTQTFSWGARENGFFIDKFAFGLTGDEFRVTDLDNGLPATGKPARPPETPAAQGLDKTLGSAFSTSQDVRFTSYFNQITPENAGKWGSVESARDDMRWENLDTAYDMAMTGGNKEDAHHVDTEFPLAFRFHVLLWGNQQPAWIEDLTQEEQLAEITEWFDAVAERYPNLELIEVVNEPVNDPPVGAGNGNYIDALGGAEDNAWLITAFSMARERWPNARLMLNEYNVLNSSTVLTSYMAMITDLQEAELIDVIGVQAHAFSTRGSAESLQAALDTLASTGLPIHVTEMDIDGGAPDPEPEDPENPGLVEDDAQQLDDYKRIFATLWNHESVENVTLWGFRPGMWRSDTLAYIVNAVGEDRQAATWMRAFVQGNQAPVITGSTTASINEELPMGFTAILLGADDPDGDNDLLGNWRIVGGADADRFEIEPATGELFIGQNQFLDYEEQSSYTVEVTVSDQVLQESEPATVTINLIDIENDGEVQDIPVWEDIEDQDRGGGAFAHLLLLLLALSGIGAIRRRTA